MVLYTNLSKVKLDGRAVTAVPVLGLTSNVFHGFAASRLKANSLRADQLGSGRSEMLFDLFEEARKNGFYTFLINGDDEEKQGEVLKSIVG